MTTVYNSQRSFRQQTHSTSTQEGETRTSGQWWEATPAQANTVPTILHNLINFYLFFKTQVIGSLLWQVLSGPWNLSQASHGLIFLHICHTTLNISHTVLEGKDFWLLLITKTPRLCTVTGRGKPVLGITQWNTSPCFHFSPSPPLSLPLASSLVKEDNLPW